MRFSYVYFLFIVCFLPWGVGAQTYSPPLRLEIETPRFEYPFYIIPMAENGVALLYETDVIENKKKKWSIILFDTNLQKVSNTDMWLEKDLRVEVVNSDNHQMFLCLQKNTRRSTIYNTYFIHYTLPQRKVNVYAVNIRDKEEVIDACFFGNYAYYTTLFNRNEDVFVLDLKTLVSRPLFPEIAQASMFQFFKPDTLTHTLWIASTYVKDKNASALVLTQLDTTAFRMQTHNIPFETDKRVNFCKLTVVDTSQLIVIGTYVDIKEASNIKNTETVNTGIFTLPIENGKPSEPRFFNFLLLNNQLDKNKMTPENKKGVSLNLQLVIDEIAHNDSLLVFIGEVFYPEYRQEYAANYGMYGYSSAPTTVFAGYRYQTAYVLTFAKTGELLWNTQIQYNDILVKSLRNVLHAYIDENQNVLLYYGMGDFVNSMILNNKNIVQSSESISLELLSPNDKLTANYSSTCKHWYGEYFIFHGYQTITGLKSNQKRNRKRDVLFINKLVYR
ncbi:MAG: hypothetical protein RBS13_04480 [Bacteroidales bacterium]|jgi:hypothetical protein|nr:hypothetical protein [Bacteroidales bacterium]